MHALPQHSKYLCICGSTNANLRQGVVRQERVVGTVGVLVEGVCDGGCDRGFCCRGRSVSERELSHGHLYNHFVFYHSVHRSIDGTKVSTLYMKFQS